MSYLIGVDIGGTKIAAAAISTRGRVLLRRELPTMAQAGAPDVISRLSASLHALEQDDEFLGIGIGCTGPLDIVRGHIQNPYTLPTFDDVDIVTPLVEEFHTRVVLENDCDAAALGEAWLGGGRDARNIVYITVGTGIGAGLILDGKLYRGVGMIAGEIGHMTIEQNGILCYCGNHGCLEMLAAGPALARAYQKFSGVSDLSARDVIDAAIIGDADARRVVELAAQYLGTGLANLITILAPDVIVLGGGVMEHYELFFPTIRATIAERVTLVPWRRVKIRPAALGANAGVIGAAKALLDRMSYAE